MYDFYGTCLTFAGSFITGVTAVDLDIGNNKLVQYSLQQTGTRYFSIDSETGVITAALSVSAGQTYQLSVRAEDKVGIFNCF